MSAANSPNVTAAQNAGSELFDDGGELGYQYLMGAQSAEERGEFMANNSSLEYEEWKQISDRVVEVRDHSLGIINDLRSMGLTKPLSLAVMTDEWQTVDQIDGEAQVDMNPGTATESSDVVYGRDGAPLPIVHMDWQIDRRQLDVSRANGTGVDTLVASQLTRKVSERLEALAVDGWALGYDGYTMDGFRTFEARNQYTGSSWTDGTSDADDIRTDIIGLIEKLEDDEFNNGNYQLYLSKPQYRALRNTIADFGGGATGDKNMRQRIKDEFDEIGSINQVNEAYLPAGEAFMFEPSPDVVELGVAEDVQPVEWETPSGWTTKMKIFAAMNVELKSTADNQCGIVHATGL